MAVYHAWNVGNPDHVQDYWEGFYVAPQVYLGVRAYPQYGYPYVAIIAATRLLSFAALTSIIIKRFNRR